MTTSSSQGLSGASTDPLSTRVLEAVAAREGVDPVDLPEPLYESVDPDALDEFFRESSSNCSVAFDYLGYRVTAYADGDVVVDELLG